MKVKSIIIDDERKALEILKNKLERLCPNVSIIGESQSPEDGLELIKKLNPDLVFLDIAMPGMSGFDLLSYIDNPDFEIIFATAFDNYAIEAIKHCAIGYLVKPVDNKDLIKAVDKAINNIEEKTALEKNRLLINNLNVKTFLDRKMVIPSNEGLEFVKISEIVYFEGENGYTRIHFKNRKSFLSSHSIGYFAKLLINQPFYLIHKSYLVNVTYIEKYLNEGYIILEDHSKLPVSRSKRQDFFSYIKNIN